MDLNAAIIDQRLKSVCDEIRDRATFELRINDEDRLKSLAFVYFCVKTILDLDIDTAFDCMTDGGQDFGVDAVHVSEVMDGEFTVSLFQGKYQKDLSGQSNFEENAIKHLITAVKYLFDPAANLENINERLKTKVAEVRGLIVDGYIPQVRVIACNNGKKWTESADQEIKRANFGSQVSWEHCNHDTLVMILQASKPVSDSLQFSGKAIVEDLNYSRVLIGRIAVSHIASLMEQYGARLLERNVRRYLGLQGNRVNESIRDTLCGTESLNFYFYNNGITLTCEKMSYNALQQSDFRVKVENLQIINGGQTCMTIFKTLKDLSQDDIPNDAYVLVRLYQLPSDNEDLVSRITLATNSQNPVDLRDLRANDSIQIALETSIKQLGYEYRRKRTDTALHPETITSGVVAEAVLSVWRAKPHQAKFYNREHFGKLYETIFKNLNGAQAIIATLLYRIAENRRRRPLPEDPAFVRYASCFLAMRMGQYLLNSIGRRLDNLDHTVFDLARTKISNDGDVFLGKSIKDVQEVLDHLFGNSGISLQQLSATFRRGDLIADLKAKPLR